MNACEEVSGRFVVACCDGAELLELGEEVLDQMSCLIKVSVIVPQDFAVCFGRDHHGLVFVSQQGDDPLIYAELDYASDAYAAAIFTFLAIREDDEFRIIQNALYLLPAILDVKPPFETRKIFSGSYRPEKLGLRPRSFIDLMQKAPTDIDDRIFQFPGDRRMSMVAPVVGQDRQSRQSILRIFSSENNHQLSHSEINLELMASERPFDNLQELMSEYSVGILRQDSIGIEIFTGNVALIDSKSKIEGEQAHLVVRIAKELKPDKFSLGYRLFQQRAVTERKRINGTAFDWLDIDRVKEDIATPAIPKGAVLQCYATYDGHVQRFFWLADSKNTLNTKRLAFSTFDCDLTSLRNIIDADEERNRKARQLEIAISWLLWMPGFSAINLGKKYGYHPRGSRSHCNDAKRPFCNNRMHYWTTKN